MKHKLLGPSVWESLDKLLQPNSLLLVQDVIALDNNATTIDSLADQVTKAAVGDITDIEFLRSAGIDTCDSVIIATGEHLESSALALLQ